MNKAIAFKPQQNYPKWYIGYYCLAAFSLVAVIANLYFSNRITSLYQGTIAVNQQWADRRNHISELGALASRVNALGNDVFESRNVAAESQRMRVALTLFTNQMKTIQAEVYRNVHPDLSTPILAELRVVNRRMTEMVNEADLIFSYFQRNLPNLAGERMAIMDQKFASLTEALHNLETKVSLTNTQLLEQQAEMAMLLQKLGYIVAILVLLIVSGAVLYGRKIAQQVRSQEADIQRYIQELHRTQAQLIQTEKMSSLGQLVAGIAHEINNPVNFVQGNLNHALYYMQSLLELIYHYQIECPSPSASLQQKIEDIDLTFLRDDLPKLLNSMKIGTERIRGIVQSLRQFSHMDEAEMKAVDIHQGIDSALMLLQHRLQENTRRPKIIILKDYAQLPLVECYPSSLNQVFMNLLTNAVDAIEDGVDRHTPAIMIRTRRSAGDRVSISIADNGPGIPDAVRAKLFDPFFTTKPVGKGTGLGLSISYQIVVEQHGGTLECQPRRDRGAEFVVEIPVRQQVCNLMASSLLSATRLAYQPKAASI